VATARLSLGHRLLLYRIHAGKPTNAILLEFHRRAVVRGQAVLLDQFLRCCSSKWRK
jgi:hypothetical protein